MFISSRRWLLDRRAFLRGAGTALALPLLDAMVPPELLAAAPAAARRPARAIFIYVPNGVATNHWFPKTAGKTFEFSRTLKPLEPLQKHLTILSGLHHPNARNGHEVDSSWLTAVDLHATPGYSFRNDVSIDQVIAEQVGKQTRYPSISLATAPGGSISWGRGSVRVPTQNDPRLVFNELFTPNGEKPDAVRKAIARDASLLDLVMEDANSMSGNLGKNDKDKLDEYLTSVREVELRLERAKGWIDVPRPKASDDFIRARGWGDNVGGYLESMYDIMALALRTDSTRVLSYAIWNETASFIIPETGVRRGQHELTHNNNAPDLLDELGKVDSFLVSAYAKFLEKLRNTPEGEGNLLDSTMVMYGSGASQTHLHYHLPILLAGGSQLGIRHGQHVDLSLAAPLDGKKSASEVLEEAMMFDGKKINPNARMSNLLLTIAQKMDLPLESFRDSVGTIREIL